MWDIGDARLRRRAKEEERVKLLSAKGFREGGVIPNTWKDEALLVVWT